ncbi:MAG: substrate-binding domain-containing protein [Deltaproteobacteria bacterium]|nr:substrate-binding domain-containing protein [Deltaproteobacteria bacterium]
MKKFYLLLAALLILPISVSAYADENRIRCASTTSTQNSGLFDYLLPAFEKDSGIKVDVVAVGTGAAIKIGKSGDADLILVHAKELELKAVEEGYFVDRKNVMYNDFVVIGDPNDPAKIKETKTATKAFAAIAAQQAPFISRGDKSGTHTKELFIWKKADVNPTGNKWYMEAGQGMAKTQRIANEKKAYTLTDRGTWLAVKDNLDMNILFEGDPILFNQYGIMAVNPEKHKHVKYDKALIFINWIISDKGQETIAAFKDKNGNPLFTPNANKK